MAEKKEEQTEFVYNEDMEKKFGEAANGENIGHRYGDKTFANQRALQGFGQG